MDSRVPLIAAAADARRPPRLAVVIRCRAASLGRHALSQSTHARGRDRSGERARSGARA